MTDTVNVPTPYMVEQCRKLLQPLAGNDWPKVARQAFALMTAAAPKVDPVKTDPQLAFENMRRHFPGDLRDWTDLTSEQRKEWEEDLSERPHLYDLRAQPEAPKVEQEPFGYAYETVGGDWVLRQDGALGRTIGKALYTDPAPASDELLEALEAIKSLEGEINENNYTHDDVCELNNAFVGAWGIADRAIAKHKGPQS